MTELEQDCADAAKRTQAPTLMRLHIAATQRRLAEHVAQNDAEAARFAPVVRILETVLWEADGSAAPWNPRVFLAMAQLDREGLETLKRLCAMEMLRVMDMIADANLAREGETRAASPLARRIVDEFGGERGPLVYMEEIKSVDAFADLLIARRTAR